MEHTQTKRKKKYSLARDKTQKEVGLCWEGPGICHAKKSGPVGKGKQLS